MDADKLIVGLAGSWPTALEMAWLQKWRPCGVILFSRNVTGPTQLKKLCSYLNSLVPGLQIMADHEGGPVSQLAAALGRPPAAWTLGAIDDVDLTRRVHEQTARLMVGAGVTWVLAPCADVMVNPHNPVIGVRAFGNSVDGVSRHVQAAVSGLLDGGVKVCLKHWPGHGSAGQDSHLESAVTDKSTMAEDAVPFHAGLSAGAGAVMVGHLYPGEDSILPATLDSQFLERTREKLSGGTSDFLLVADDITMGGLRKPMADAGVGVASDTGEGLLEPTDLPCGWFEALDSAGCDLLLIRGLPLLAFPVDAPPGETVPVLPEEGIDASAAVAEYEESRLRAGCDTEFFRNDGPVLWVDLTRGDRWAVASGTQHGQERALSEVLDSAFVDVVKVSDVGNGSLKGASFARLVVVSHRPLAWDSSNPPAWLADLADKGHAIVMGHPSLEADFFAALTPHLKANWLISPVYDVTGGDLRPGE